MASPVLDENTLRFGRLLHYAGIAAVLVCGATSYGLLYTPVEESIFETHMRIDELAMSKTNAEAIRREHDRLSSRLEKIESRYAALQRRVPENAEAGNFLKFVSQIAHEENLTIGNFQPGQAIEGDGYMAMEVMLDGTGNFASICSFFNRLTAIQRLSKVKDVSISVDRASEVYPMKATIMIYFGLNSGTATPSKTGDRNG